MLDFVRKCWLHFHYFHTLFGETDRRRDVFGCRSSHGIGLFYVKMKVQKRSRCVMAASFMKWKISRYLDNCLSSLGSYLPKHCCIMDEFVHHTAASERAKELQKIGGMMADMHFWQDVDASTLSGFVWFLLRKKLCALVDMGWCGLCLWALITGEARAKVIFRFVLFFRFDLAIAWRKIFFKLLVDFC